MTSIRRLAMTSIRRLATMAIAVVGAMCSIGCGAAGSSAVTVGRPDQASQKASQTGANYASRQEYRVPGGDMEPTLNPDARVTTVKFKPAVGTIVVAEAPIGATMHRCGTHSVKPGGPACDAKPVAKEGLTVIDRIVAGPRDEIYIKDGHVYRKAPGSSAFVREHEPYIRPCSSQPECSFPTPITIPNGEWFLMGDNRGEADDSREWGPIPTAWIIGRVLTVNRRAS